MRSPYRESTITEIESRKPARDSRRERHVLVALTASLFASTLTYATYRIHSLPTPLHKEQCQLEINVDPDRDRGWPQSSEMKCEDLVRPLK